MTHLSGKLTPLRLPTVRDSEIYRCVVRTLVGIRGVTIEVAVGDRVVASIPGWADDEVPILPHARRARDGGV